MRVEIYIKSACPYCKKALLVLKRHDVSPEIVDIAQVPKRKPEMIKRSGRTTVPQIFFDGEHIGGCDELVALEKRGQLAERLGT